MSKQPNILIIYPDQMRYDAMGCAGNPLIRTPHIDRLSREGVHFSESYTSYPICCPFRASMLTGKYAQAHGMTQNHFPLRGDQTFLAQCLRDAGYRTGYVGKWHLEGGPKPGFVPPDRRFGFEHFVGFNRGHDYQSSVYFDDEGQAYHSKRYEPDYQTDQFMEFIESAAGAEDGKPFFGYVSFGPPHFPMQMPEYLRHIYRPDEVPLPPGVPDPQLQRVFDAGGKVVTIPPEGLILSTRLAEKLGVTMEQIACVGDDVPDMECMQAAGLAVAVADAHSDLDAVADWHTHLGGGRGAVREVCDLLLAAHSDQATG